MDRRTFLAMASAAGVAGVAGCETLDDIFSDDSTPQGPTVGTARSDRTQWSERVVDARTGADISGLVGEVGGGELLVVPSGRYRWTQRVRNSRDDWGIRCQRDTVLEVPAGFGDGDDGKLLRTYDDGATADNVRLENLTFDAPGRAAPGIELGVRTSARISGLHYRMNGPLGTSRQENGLGVFVEDSDGLARIVDYRQFNNGDLGRYGDGDTRVGMYTGPQHNGTVHLSNPVLQGFPNNACYVSRQSGTVVVEGGLLLNNNVSAVRVSGGVGVLDTTVVIDTDRYRAGAGQIAGSTHNTRGLWGDSHDPGTDGGRAIGVSFIVDSYERCTGLATLLDNPRMTLRNCQFLLGANLTCLQPGSGRITVLDSDFARASGDAGSVATRSQSETPGAGGALARPVAGTGDITGSGNRVAPGIAPGAVPVSGRGPTFDWSETHPETPNRPTLRGLDRPSPGE